MQTIEIAKGYSPELLQAIIEIDKESFEKQYDDVENYYKDALENQANINVFLKEEGRFIGYLLAIPQDEAYKDLKAIDPEMKPDSERFYVETIEVFPDYRDGGGAFKMIFAMIEEAGKRGINKFAMHTSVENGLSKSVQKCFGNMIKKVRRIENWPYYYNGEATDYLEGIYSLK